MLDKIANLYCNLFVNTNSNHLTMTTFHVRWTIKVIGGVYLLTNSVGECTARCDPPHANMTIERKLLNCRKQRALLEQRCIVSGLYRYALFAPLYIWLYCLAIDVNLYLIAIPFIVWLDAQLHRGDAFARSCVSSIMVAIFVVWKMTWLSDSRFLRWIR